MDCLKENSTDYGKLTNFKIHIRKCLFGRVLCLCSPFKCHVKFDEMSTFNEDKMSSFNEVKILFEIQGDSFLA